MMKLKNLMKSRLGRRTLGLAAAAVMAFGAGTASATLVSDVTLGASIFSDSVDTFFTSDSPVIWDAFDSTGEDNFAMLDLADTDLLITSDPDGLEGRSMDYAIDTNILSILYSVTGGALTSANYVVAEFSYASSLSELLDTDGQSADVSLFEATLTNPPAIPEAGSIALLLSGFGLLGVVRARRQRG